MMHDLNDVTHVHLDGIRIQAGAVRVDDAERLAALIGQHVAAALRTGDVRAQSSAGARVQIAARPGESVESLAERIARAIVREIERG
jgi:hypothetical protein